MFYVLLVLSFFFHIFLTLCNFIFSFKNVFVFIYLFSHHLFICNWLFIYLISYLGQICLETHMVECSRERCMHTVFRSLDLVFKLKRNLAKQLCKEKQKDLMLDVCNDARNKAEVSPQIYYA